MQLVISLTGPTLERIRKKILKYLMFGFLISVISCITSKNLCLVQLTAHKVKFIAYVGFPRAPNNKLPYRGKLRRGKVTKFWLTNNFPQRIIFADNKPPPSSQTSFPPKNDFKNFKNFSKRHKNKPF